MKKLKIIESKNFGSNFNQLNIGQMRKTKGGFCINYSWDGLTRHCGVKIGGVRRCINKNVTTN